MKAHWKVGYLQWKKLFSSESVGFGSQSGLFDSHSHRIHMVFMLGFGIFLGQCGINPLVPDVD